MDFIRRWFTLPKRYNSLSDIARDPLGALANAAQWAVPLATGLPGGIASLPQLLSKPDMLLKWSLGNVVRNFSIGSLARQVGRLGAKDLALIAGGSMMLQGQQRADAATRALAQQGDLYRQLYDLNRPVYEQIMGLRLDALRGLPSQSDYEAQARRALDNALNAIEQSELQRGVRTLSAERRRAEAANRYATTVAAYPLERLRLLYGLPASQALQPLQLQTGILNQISADAQAQLAQLGQAVALLLGYAFPPRAQ